MGGVEGVGFWRIGFGNLPPASLEAQRTGR